MMPCCVQMKPEQERVKTVLIDTVALLCKNGLSYERELKIEAVIGVTTDETDVFLVHINESFSGHGASSSSSVAAAAESSMAVVPFSPRGQQTRREFEAPRTPSSGAKRMKLENIAGPPASPSTDQAKHLAKQQLRFPSPAKSPSVGILAQQLPGPQVPLHRGMKRETGSGRGFGRGSRRGAAGRGPLGHRFPRGSGMSRASGRPTAPRGAARLPHQQLPRHQLPGQQLPGNQSGYNVNRMTSPSSSTAADSSVGFYQVPATSSFSSTAAAGPRASSSAELPTFGSTEPDHRYVNAVSPGFGFDSVFPSDVQSGSFADINPSLEFGLPPGFGLPGVAGSGFGSSSNVAGVSAADMKTESLDDDVILVDDAVSDDAATAAGAAGSSNSVISDNGDGEDGVPGAAVQQITRRVTITTNIQGQNVKYEQV